MCVYVCMRGHLLQMFRISYRDKYVEVHVHPVAKLRPEFHFCVCVCECLYQIFRKKIYEFLRSFNLIKRKRNFKRRKDFIIARAAGENLSGCEIAVSFARNERKQRNFG